MHAAPMMTDPEPTPVTPPAPAAQPEAPASAAATKPAPARPSIDQLPPYRVLLHNDDEHDMLEVVEALVELTPLNKTRAVEVMLEAHTRGLALVLMTHKERAELYEQQLRSKTLTVTIEPAI